MVTIQETELKEGILLGIDRAKKMGRSILVSEVHKIDHIEPLSFFHAGREFFLGERFFWKDPSDETYIIGNGIVKQIQSDQATDRFFHVEKAWKRFIDDAIIFDAFSENGIAPLMFGGFSFDPHKQKTSLWSKFADSLFHIPKYMLSIIKGQAYLTTNTVCTHHDDLSLFHKVVSERNQLLASISPVKNSQSLLNGSEEIAPDTWRETVTQVVKDLKHGPLKKVVLARELRLHFETEVETENVLSRLDKEQHESFIFAFESNGDCFIGASPERLVKKAGMNIFSTCLAGSIPRGKTVEEDKTLGELLLNDQKNLIEHQYVVDMIKEALEETCQRVTLPARPQLMKIRDIQHLYTPVIGESKKDTSLLLLVERLHPTPALGGLPKKEAVDKIREVEILDRGFYAAPLGWMDYRRNGEFAVSIRSALIQGKDASLFAGCGVVADSDSDSEYLETSLKFRPMLTALGGNGK
ncbi:isochorismate synthase [Neobacillus sp. PS3-34]|uniref:isochorismate synthase n=1 Tax=Neobacillus sp. PS3-34 TaxID=3070678 RepID=UPI0027E05FC9|nr:isochorismate synthase [Neobacillus sp. PS3-34]WML47229.1 isochorismate synthase [Neobacillus sp. PS3-34]